LGEAARGRRIPYSVAAFDWKKLEQDERVPSEGAAGFK
jgi:hypothetical protein